MKIGDWLARAAHQAPDAPALSEGETLLTYGALDRRAGSAARRLATLGAGRGTRVALDLEPSIDHVVLLHALIRLGAVTVPLDPRLTPQERARRLETARPELLIEGPEQVAEAGEDPDAMLVDRRDGGEVLCVIHTSGTGGAARPVELTYSNIHWSALGSAARTGVAPADRWLCCMPLHHVGGLSIPLRCAIFGASVELASFDPPLIAELLTERPVTLASLVPTMLARLLDADAGPGRLRCVLLGGGPAPAALVDRAVAAGVPVAPTYGLTEAASQVATLEPGQAGARPGSVGPPLAHVAVRIGAGDRILVRGPSVAPGVADRDEWLDTGDLGRIDPDGHLHVLGRADDVIVTGGENVLPEEVERVLLSHPHVRDAAVAGREDLEWQAAVVAYVVPAAGVSPPADELRAFCRERLAGYKVPKAFELVVELPRNAQGKLLRRELDEMRGGRHEKPG